MLREARATVSLVGQPSGELSGSIGQAKPQMLMVVMPGIQPQRNESEQGVIDIASDRQNGW